MAALYEAGQLVKSPDFIRSIILYLIRADWLMVKCWDFLIEARMIDVKAAQDKIKGFLTASHRHFGQNLKVGSGYNFTDFSDDLTNLDYDAKGWFINIIGKI